MNTKNLFFTALLVLLSACSEDGYDVSKEDISFKPVTISYNATDAVINRDVPKDSFIYNTANTVEEYYQFRKNGSIRKYYYSDNANGEVTVYRDGNDEPEYVVNAVQNNSWTIDLLGYERRTSTPGMIKYTIEGNVIIITRWEYPSLENPDYVMEIDGDIVKRTIVTLNEVGNISKIEVYRWDYDHQALKINQSLTDIVYDDKVNPLKNLRKEYIFWESGLYYNHEFIEFYGKNNVISYNANYHDYVNEEIDGVNHYTFSYEFDEQSRVTSSKVSAGLGEYRPCIYSIMY